ncbi:pirin family protein [Luteimonas sp. e5]
MPLKAIASITASAPPHWVGDGFPMRSVFDYRQPGVELRSPFLLLDYAPLGHFEPNPGPPRGVGVHPHRGFETVTFAFSGEVAHRDSTGQGGVIGPGDVQWMTAGGGILHEEFHSRAYSDAGGAFEMAQLWVDLPAARKMTAPGYQAITAADIPLLELPDGAGTLRLVAGEFAGQRGPAHTFSPMRVGELRLAAGADFELQQPEGWSLLLVALDGAARLNGEADLPPQHMATFAHAGERVRIAADEAVRLLLLSGAPLQQPVVGHGPFVMTRQADIAQALHDLRSGRFGRLD